jgi:serine/threonine protein kinase
VKYLTHIAENLKKMHASNHSHNDIKIENCFIDTTNDQAMLGDLGTAAHFEKNSPCGSYPAPEFSTINGAPLLAPACIQNDCWAFARVIYEMTLGFCPYKMGWADGTLMILSGATLIRTSLAPSTHPLHLLICALLSVDPAARPSMDEVIRCLKAAQA